VSRGRGKGSPALGLGPTAVVHSPDARRSVEAGRDGIDRRDDERLGCKLVEGGGGGEGVASKVHFIWAWRSANTRKVMVESNHARNNDSARFQIKFTFLFLGFNFCFDSLFNPKANG
jgi:hypothetical protein